MVIFWETKKKKKKMREKFKTLSSCTAKKKPNNCRRIKTQIQKKAFGLNLARAALCAQQKGFKAPLSKLESTD